MNKENITITKITADEGKFLTNGKVYGKEIYLVTSQSPDDYYEISEQEYVKLTAVEE